MISVRPKFSDNITGFQSTDCRDVLSDGRVVISLTVQMIAVLFEESDRRPIVLLSFRYSMANETDFLE